MMSSSNTNKTGLETQFYTALYRMFQFGLGLFGPAALSSFSGDLRAFLGTQGSGTRRAPFESSQASKSDGSRVLERLCWRLCLGEFANRFQKDLMSKLIRITGAFAGAVRHNAFIMAGSGAVSI
jgi:hypothetical protein